MAKNEKTSLKPVPLSLRGKKRYIEFKLIVESNQPLHEKDVSLELWQVLRQNYGEFGLAEQKFWLIAFDPKTSSGVVRCAHDKAEQVKTGLLFLKKVRNSRVIPRILKVSGSIKKIKQKKP